MDGFYQNNMSEIRLLYKVVDCGDREIFCKILHLDSARRNLLVGLHYKSIRLSQDYELFFLNRIIHYKIFELLVLINNNFFILFWTPLSIVSQAISDSDNAINVARVQFLE